MNANEDNALIERAKEMAVEVLEYFKNIETVAAYVGQKADEQKRVFLTLTLRNFAQNEVEMWKDRCNAEHEAHVQTIEHYEKMLNQLEDGR